MRTSQYLLSTLKETPADAEIISHQLMLRAGMIRRLASGLYTWLPLGLRVLRKAEAMGKGAAQLDGRMIDAASERMAMNVLVLADAIAAK